MSGSIRITGDYFPVKPSDKRARQLENEGIINGEQGDPETIGVRTRLHSQVNYLLCHHVSVPAV